MDRDFEAVGGSLAASVVFGLLARPPIPIEFLLFVRACHESRFEQVIAGAFGEDHDVAMAKKPQRPGFVPVTLGLGENADCCATACILNDPRNPKQSATAFDVRGPVIFRVALLNEMPKSDLLGKKGSNRRLDSIRSWRANLRFNKH